MKFRCESCKGVYESPQLDPIARTGYEYYHVCPLGIKDPRDERKIFVYKANGEPEMVLTSSSAIEKHYTQVVKGIRSEGKGRVKA